MNYIKDLINKIYGSNIFIKENLVFADLKDLSFFVKEYLSKKGKNIEVKYFKDTIGGIEFMRLQVIGSFHGLYRKNASMFNRYIEDSAGIKIIYKNLEDNLDINNKDLKEAIINFLNDLYDIKTLKKESEVHTGAYGGNNW